MSDAFICRRGGGLSNAYAAIAASYPSGSTCTCTKGSKTLTAKGTGGSYLFLVPESGTWTVSCTDGNKTTSKDVSVTAQYQAKSVTLAYQLVLYSPANTHNDITGGWTSKAKTGAAGAGAGSAATVTNASDRLTIAAAGYATNITNIVNKIDLTDYTTLTFDGYATLNQSNNSRIRVYQVEGTYLIDTGVVTGVIPTSRGTVNLDVSGLNGEYYISVCPYPYGDAVTAYVYNLYLE